MNQQPIITELIETVSQSLEADGITAEYIQQLSYTWNALKKYLLEHNLTFSRESGVTFLEEIYGISPTKGYANLRPIDKRHKRAVFILINCAEGLSLYRKKTYWPCAFEDSYATIFLNFLDERKSHDFALSTINRDIYTLNHFSKYLQMSNISDISVISPQIVQGFMKWLATSKNLPTLKSVTATMRQLLRYLHRKGYLSDDYSTAILTVRCRKIVPTVYGEAEIEAMLSSFNRAGSVGIRNYAMVLMAVRLGMRASDICGLEFKNIHWEKNTIEFITQKTGKSTVLPLIADVGNAIIKYLKEVRPDVKDNHVFLRMQAPFGKLNPAALHNIVTKAFRDANVVVNPGRKHGPHALRASLATMMLEKEVPLPVISETLSHSNTDTTKIYLKVDMHHLRKLALEVPDLTGVWMGGVRI